MLYVKRKQVSWGDCPDYILHFCSAGIIEKTTKALEAKDATSERAYNGRFAE